MGRDRELPPPLEMMCLNALWEIGEGNVEDVRKVVSTTRPLAYTTVLTLLDRLARRGAVSRRKEGRGFRYQPTVERDKLRRMALRQFLEYHFDGSRRQTEAVPGTAGRQRLLRRRLLIPRRGRRSFQRSEDSGRARRTGLATP